MRGVPWWGVISSVAAPVLLIGGWTVAAGLQPRFDPVADTVSALAAIGATDRWVMTLVFLLVGVCYHRHRAGAPAGKDHRTADPDRGRRRGHAGGGQPGARRGLRLGPALRLGHDRVGRG